MYFSTGKERVHWQLGKARQLHTSGKFWMGLPFTYLLFFNRTWDLFIYQSSKQNSYFVFRDIENYFHGHHVTINARSEDEVCIEDILNKVSKASASKFNFNGRCHCNLNKP